jgi:hypothetical protein
MHTDYLKYIDQTSQLTVSVCLSVCVGRARCTVYCVRWTACGVWCTVYGVRCATYCVLCTVYGLLVDRYERKRIASIRAIAKLLSCIGWGSVCGYFCIPSVIPSHYRSLVPTLLLLVNSESFVFQDTVKRGKRSSVSSFARQSWCVFL